MKVRRLAKTSRIKDAPPQNEERYQIEGISNAVALLKAFSRVRPERHVADLARETGVSEALTRRTLETLAQHDFIRECGDDEYSLGFGWLSLADIRRRQVGMRQIAYPLMRALRDRLNETVILSIRSGFRRISIDNVESGQPIRRTAQSGFETPLHIGSAGKVLLAGLSPDELDAYFESVPLRAFDGGAHISRADLMAEISLAQNQGYCIALREITADAAAVSAPLYDHRGQTCAVLTVSLPADRFSSSLRAQCIRDLLKVTAEISVHLGFSPPHETPAGGAA